MVFYLHPPRGSMTLQRLETLCLVRLRFLLEVNETATSLQNFHTLVQQDEFVANSDVLMEHNASDVASHFLLRLLGEYSVRLRAAILAGERRLFRHRLSSMDQQELCTTLQSAHAQASRMRSRRQIDGAGIATLLDTVVSVTGAALRHLQQQLQPHSPCHQPLVRVWFGQLLPLVASRLLTLRRGYALPLCCHLPETLTCLHDSALLLSSSAPTSDSRLLQLVVRCEQLIKPSATPVDASGCDLPPLTVERLRSSCRLLPPCMSRLYTRLMRSHRLSHADRFTLTLFFKDAGMSLAENMRLWRTEYSRPAVQPDGTATSCTHSWQRNRYKYEYGLRHMYGLEGKRISYDSHSCQRIQRDCGVSVTSFGGCPFMDSTADSLHSLFDSLPELGEDTRSEITAGRLDTPSVSCARYLAALGRQAKLSDESVNSSNCLPFDKPCQFFSRARSIELDW